MRRRILWLTAGFLYLLLMSCNVARAVNGHRSGAVSTVAGAPAGTLPLVTSIPPGAAPTAAVRQPLAAGTPAGTGAAASPATSSPLTPSSTPASTPTGSAAASAASAGSATVVAPRSPVASSARPNAFSTIQGNALRATGLGLSGVTVR